MNTSPLTPVAQPTDVAACVVAPLLYSPVITIYCLLGRVAAGLSLRLGQAVAIAPGLVGHQLLAETKVTITRPAFPHRRKRGIKQPRERVYGKPLQLRLIVSRVVLADDKLYAEWLPLTNLPEEVRAERIAQWYVWRWKVESHFKLLKSSGHNLEHWQQESAEAIAAWLSVTAMAAVVIWQLAGSQAPESEQASNLSVRLSGRQMRGDRPATGSAMLGGLWRLVAMLRALEQYSLDELRQVACLSLPGFFAMIRANRPTCVDANACAVRFSTIWAKHFSANASPF